MEIEGGIGRRMRGVFSGTIRGVSDPHEGSKSLSFLFRTQLVCSSLLHLRSSFKPNCPKFGDAFARTGRYAWIELSH
jgi:hypothetical protein